MSQNIYIAGTEQGSGKPAIVLALMELLSGDSSKLGFFRPIIQGQETEDTLIHLIVERYQLKWSYESMYGCTNEVARELIASNRYDELQKRIMAKYKELEKQCDHVLCMGTNYSEGELTNEFDFNADIANNLGCLLMPVLRGNDRSISNILNAVTSVRQSLRDHDCDILATIINGIAPEYIDELNRHFEQQDDEHTQIILKLQACYSVGNRHQKSK
jgi:phosphate acetyltransferase